MKRIFNIIFIGILLSTVACTSARWTVKNKSATDQSDFRVLEQKRFLTPVGKVTPDNPVLNIDLLSRTKYRYAQKVLLQRNIQKYRLRPGFLAFGLGSAAMAFYVANSKTFGGNVTSAKSLTLNAAGTLLALSGFLNMKPVGKPRPTGEERYLRPTGSTVKVDTLEVKQSKDASASITVQYKNKVIFEEEHHPFKAGHLEIPLANKLSELQLQGKDPGNISIAIAYEDSNYTYHYPISTILQPYARVTKQLTELRNAPEKSRDNILADLVHGSLVRILDTKNPGWYKVQYGISTNYVLKKDADMVWRPSDFAQENEVVTVPQVPFGNIDVESNIPILRGLVPNAYALIVTNQNYGDDKPERNYAHRDGRLIKQYLTNALGFSEQSVFDLQDVDEPQKLYDVISQIKAVANDSTELFVYLSGYGTVGKDGNNFHLGFQGTKKYSDGSRNSIPIDRLLQQLASIPSSGTIVLSDIDYSSSVTKFDLSRNEQQRIIDTQMAAFSNSQGNKVLLMGERLDQPSSLYFSNRGEDKKHHVFPYFFAKALQQRKTGISAIYQYLERNVSYTARKLHDRPQDPLLIGNTSLDLVLK